jgi:hypothetical protein
MVLTFSKGNLRLGKQVIGSLQLTMAIVYQALLEGRLRLCHSPKGEKQMINCGTSNIDAQRLP